MVILAWFLDQVELLSRFRRALILFLRLLLLFGFFRRVLLCDFLDDIVKLIPALKGAHRRQIGLFLLLEVFIRVFEEWFISELAVVVPETLHSGRLNILGESSEWTFLEVADLQTFLRIELQSLSGVVLAAGKRNVLMILIVEEIPPFMHNLYLLLLI
jgi:hypothetical protein